MRLSTKDFPLASAFEAEVIEIDPALLARLGENRARVLAALDERPVYGVNTGMGRLAGVAAPASSEHQRSLLIGRAVGGPPWLSAEEVRWLLLVRLRDLLAPEAGASPELVTFLVDRLNDGFTPAVPRTGLGSAGEIIPLAHAFQTFLGVGTVLVDGVETPASEVLAEPYEPGLKEAATLIQGSPLAETLAAFALAEVRQVVELQTLAAAIAIDVLGAPQGVYRPALAGDDQVLRSVLREVSGLIRGAVERPVVQAPVSVRVAPRALAHLTRVAAELDEVLGRSVPTDSPAFLDGEFVSTTGFHAVELGLRMDAVTAALVHLGEVSVQRTHRLLDERFSGLPAQLAVEPGPRAGLVPLHKRAVGELHALRRLATPATLGSVDTSGGQEDVQAFAWAAGNQLREACARMFAITACELITGSQARWLASGDGAPELRATYERLRELVPPVEEDRALGPAVTAVVSALRNGFPRGPGSPARAESPNA
ncbi:aromatic amino acid lyase [Amycolatopsis keratiniphila]|uniref:aromatic amino acid lyase n=1 Tax=Amycolatopsis keratiniphila TaxID=129921 RepID=UPI00087BE4D5|nr:aromatic amino acid lyase [Amycolatopsis keratiniphila]OLZ56246.1 histidine ammonia-lyase [Amycolatopsis keratiniphila subsp. nogabecina]SDU52775.1 histidine ammonia-lyase [Amycolatopsis keratiniphila]